MRTICESPSILLTNKPLTHTSNKKNMANRAVIDQRRRLLSEWRAWRAHIVEELQGDSAEVHRAEDLKHGDDDAEVIEEIVEEIIDETEEVIQ
jgi:translation initiation factor 3 subunit B